MRSTRLIVAALLVLGIAAPLLAVPTVVHEDATSEAFRAGTPDGVVVAQAGLLRPGARYARLETEEAGVWSLALGGDGALYAGTGNEGRILAVSGRDVTIAHETGSVLVAAMTRGPDGEVYAGTVPDGRVFRLERMPSGLNVSLLAALPDPNVWALDVDELGRVFAGTGPGGRVYRIAPDGRAEVVLETGDDNVLAVKVDGRGGLLVGTGGKGLLFRLTPKKDGYDVRVLRDFDEEEVRALALVDGTIYAAANHDRGGSDVGVVTGLVKSVTDAAASGERAEPVPAEDEVGKEGSGEGAGKALLSGALYRVEPGGGAEKVLASADSGIASLAVDGAGGVLIAAGRGGRIYRYRPETGTELIADLAADHAGPLLVVDGTLHAVGAANVGSIHRIAAEAPSVYTSGVVDAGYVADFGTLTLDSDARGLVVETRAGNTEEPDGTWEPWRGLRAPDPERGEPAEGALRIASAPARFLQYRLRWPVEDHGAVRRVTFAYRCRNRAPRLSRPTVVGTAAGEDVPAEEQGDDGQPKRPTRAESARGPIKTIRWKVDAVDGDPVAHELAYREVGEEGWRPLPVLEEKRAETTYTWDTTTVPDGRYVVRVRVTDAPGNPDGARSDEQLTEPFLVDNRKPLVELASFEVTPEGGVLTGTVRDGFSRITEIAVSIDGGPWMPVAPRDRLLDEPVEAFEIRLPAGLAPGAHSVMVGATDEAGNTGVTGRTLRVE